MKRSELVGLVNGLKYKLEKFDLDELLKKFEKKNVSKEQINTFLNHVYSLEEDLIIIECGGKYEDS